MAQVVRVNSNSPRIQYAGMWMTRKTVELDGTEMFSSNPAPGASFFFIFRGTGIKIYGTSGGQGQGLFWSFGLDRNNARVPTDGTAILAPLLLLSVGNMTDGDHQLLGSVEGLLIPITVSVDYFEIEDSWGGGIDPLWAGPNATSVPKEASIVENTSSDIVFANTTTWFFANTADHHGLSVSYTADPRAWFNFSFNGVAIWYYGYFVSEADFFYASIDGSTPERVNATNDRLLFTQRMLWSRTDLAPGGHTLAVTANGSLWLDVDFFRVLPSSSDVTAVPPPTEVPSQTAVPSQTNTNPVPLAVGLTIGLLTLVALVVGGVLFLRHRRKGDPIDPGVPPDSLYIIPYVPLTIQVDGQPGAPQSTKRLPQPNQPPNVHAATDGDISELPPSYDGHMHDGGVVQQTQNSLRIPVLKVEQRPPIPSPSVGNVN